MLAYRLRVSLGIHCPGDISKAWHTVGPSGASVPEDEQSHAGHEQRHRGRFGDRQRAEQAVSLNVGAARTGNACAKEQFICRAATASVTEQQAPQACYDDRVAVGTVKRPQERTSSGIECVDRAVSE